MTTSFENPSSRRRALKKIAGSAAVTLAGLSLSERVSAAEASLENQLKGKINHSVCRWCYQNIPFEDHCKTAKNIGIASIELVGPEEWPILQKYGLTAALPWGAGKGITEGFNNPAFHDELIKSYTDMIPKVAAAGYSQIICFSGNRHGLEDEQGTES